MLKYLALTLLICSCASKPKMCKFERSERFGDTKFVEFQCDGYKKYCKYNAKTGENLDCFVTRLK